jgi:hypothetical protein
VRISASHGKLVQWAIRHGHQLDLLSLYCCKSSSGAVEHVLIMRSCLNDFVRSCLLPSELFVRLLNLQIKTATLPSTCKDGTSTSHPKWCQMSQVAFYNVLAESWCVYCDRDTTSNVDMHDERATWMRGEEKSFSTWWPMRCHQLVVDQLCNSWCSLNYDRSGIGKLGTNQKDWACAIATSHGGELPFRAIWSSSSEMYGTAQACRWPSASGPIAQGFSKFWGLKILIHCYYSLVFFFIKQPDC